MTTPAMVTLPPPTGRPVLGIDPPRSNTGHLRATIRRLSYVYGAVWFAVSVAIVSVPIHHANALHVIPR